TSYSRAPYFVQQKMKNALVDHSKYALSFNVVPYDHKNDDIGVMLNGSYTFGKTSQVADLKIYGVDKDEKTVAFDGNFNKIFTNKENSDDNFIPIIINKTISVKSSLNVGDTLNTSFLRNELAKSNQVPIDLNNDVKFG